MEEAVDLVLRDEPRLFRTTVLGIGVAPPTPDWGLMIAEGRSFVSFAPWIAGVPGTALAILLIALSVVGDGVRERFDPKLRKQG